MANQFKIKVLFLYTDRLRGYTDELHPTKVIFIGKNIVPEHKHKEFHEQLWECELVKETGANTASGVYFVRPLKRIK